VTVRPLLAHTIAGTPQVFVALGALVVAYTVAEVRRRGEGLGNRDRFPFAGGVLAIAIALAGPLHDLAAELFSAHMAQHVLLTVVAPPLLLLGRPGRRLSSLLPADWIVPVGRAGRRAHTLLLAAGPGTGMVLAVTAATLVLWAWHIPVLYEAAVLDPVVHALEHAMLLGTGLLFWAEVMRLNRRGSHPHALLGLFVAGGSGAALGVLLAFSGRVAYTVHAAGAARFGLTPLEDQQVAAVGMWMGGGLVYVFAAVVVAAHWLAAARNGAEPELPAVATLPTAPAGSRS